MNLLNNLFSLFSKKTETPLIGEFALIKRTDIARFKGINDEENKVIEHYKKGILIATYPYTKAHVRAIKEVDEIPVVDTEEFEDDEEFFFEEPTDFGMIKEERY